MKCAFAIDRLPRRRKTGASLHGASGLHCHRLMFVHPTAGVLVKMSRLTMAMGMGMLSLEIEMCRLSQVFPSTAQAFMHTRLECRNDPPVLQMLLPHTQSIEWSHLPFPLSSEVRTRTHSAGMSHTTACPNCLVPWRPCILVRVSVHTGNLVATQRDGSTTEPFQWTVCKSNPRVTFGQVP
jgi:hypothetical protein